MCCRYYILSETYTRLPGLLGCDTDGEGITGDIRPADRAAVVCAKEGKPALEMMKWGYPGVMNKGLIINARAESLEEKAMFRLDYQFRRCVIPAAGFYEWDKNRQKATFRLPEERICYLAGIFRLFADMAHFAVITTAANASMIRIHERMPLLIAEADILQWLGDGFRELMRAEMPLLDVHIENEQLSFA